MIYCVNAGADRSLDARGAVRVLRHIAAPTLRFDSDGTQSLVRVLLGTRWDAVIEYRRGSQYFDEVCAILKIRPNRLDDFLGTAGIFPVSIAAILSPATRAIAGASGSPPRPSMRRAARMMVTLDSAAAVT